MKPPVKLSLLLCLLSYSCLLFAQTGPVNIISKDSLIQCVKELTGNLPVKLNGKMDTIKTRAALTTGNRLASKYIFDKLRSMGAGAEIQYFHGDYKRPGPDYLPVAPDFTGITSTPKTLLPLWFCTDWGEIFCSKDNTPTLISSLKSSMPRTDRLDWIRALDQNTVIAMGSSGMFALTTDGGISWIRKRALVDSVIYFFTSPSAVMIAVGKSGVIYRSNDYGVNWSKITIDPSVQLSAGCFLDDNHAVLIGNNSALNGVAYESTDKGLNWKYFSLNVNEPLKSVFSTDPKHLWIASSKGKICYSNTSGLSWTISSFADSANSAKKVFFSDSLNGWILCENNYIYRSQKGGEKWTMASIIDTPRLVRDYIFLDDKNGILSGLEYSAKRSYDAGLTWKDNTEPLLFNVIGNIRGTKYPEKYILLTCHSDCGLYGTNSDQQWLSAPGADDDASGVAAALEIFRVFQKQPLPVSIKLAAIPDEDIFLYGSKYLSDKLLGATDTFLLAFDFDMVGYDHLNPSTFTCAFYPGEAVLGLYKQFSAMIENANIPIKTVSWPNVHSGNLGGFINLNKPLFSLLDAKPNSGVNPNYHKLTDIWSTLNYDYLTNITKSAALFIYNYAQNNILSIEPGNKISEPYLTYLEDCYPNPFNSGTTISYSIAEALNVKITLYDMLGKEITTIVNEFKTSGRYSVKFNASALPSGIYLYTIQAGNYRDSKKLMLLK
ncbi:MAG: M20/M25/M40 family metallo-hydrolase [Bacillota bacterium]